MTVTSRASGFATPEPGGCWVLMGSRSHHGYDEQMSNCKKKARLGQYTCHSHRDEEASARRYYGEPTNPDKEP